MATERLEMQVLREVLRQKLVLGRSHREVVAAIGVSIGKVSSVLARAHTLGLDAAGVEAMSDAELGACLYPKATAASLRPEPDCAALHLELRRKGVTLALLHVEFVELHPGDLGYSAFCNRYQFSRHLVTLRPSRYGFGLGAPS